MYDRMRWRNNRDNIRAYKEVCRDKQRYERQLRRERQRRNIQRINNNPRAEIAIAIRRQKDARKRQKALDNLTGQQIAHRDYAIYMRDKLDTTDVIDIEVERFDVEEKETTKLIEAAITTMGRNKATGSDHLHVEMMKANAPAVASTLAKWWKSIGKTKIVPAHWLKGIIVPLFKGKGEMVNPKNYRPLCILSHARKVI